MEASELTTFLCVVQIFSCQAYSRGAHDLLHSAPTYSPRNQPSSNVTMLSVTQITAVATGSDVKMQCEFHMLSYDSFINPIIWDKVQNYEKTRINIQGVVQQPFAASKRFSITFSPNVDNRYTISLYIKDVRLEDAGNYTCEVRGQRSTVLSNVTHTLHVIGFVYSMVVAKTESNVSATTTSITVEEEKVNLFLCTANSTCPAPETIFHLGNFDLSPLAQWSQEVISMSGTPGLRMMHCSRLRWIRLALREKDDNKLFRCSIVAGLHQPNWTEVLINVQYAPIIKCKNASANLGDFNVSLECEVRSRPDLTALFWFIDSNGTTVSGSGKHNEYQTLVRVAGEGSLVTQLMLSYVKHNSFRSYTVEAVNTIGTSKRTTRLERRSNPQRSTSEAIDETVMIHPSSSRLFNKPNGNALARIRPASSVSSRIISVNSFLLIITLQRIILTILLTKPTQSFII